MQKTWIGSAVMLGCLMCTVAVADDTDIAAAMTAGKASTNLRYRYEFVDQDSASLANKQANASTARLRLNYRTAEWRKLTLFGEFDYVGHIIATDFDSGGATSPDKSGVYPVVADPSGADLNQLYLDIAASDATKIRLGRQRIVLDNQRFVGGVAWRQNEQTYDGVTVLSSALRNTALSYSYINRVKRIFGDQSPVGSDRVDGHLLNGKIAINEIWSAVPYIYYLDYKNAARAANSTATFGVRFAGSVGLGEGKLGIVAEYATQSDTADNPSSYRADYLHADFSWAMENGVSLGLGFERLGSDSGTASFRTPLATLHKFQGWADKFLATPPVGIDDVYGSVKFNASGWNFLGVYHNFQAETGGGDFGSEIDLSAAHKISDNYSLLLKAAFFNGDSGSVYDDTTKVWLMFTAGY